MYLQPNLCTICACLLLGPRDRAGGKRGSLKYVGTSSTRILDHNINNNKINAVGTHTSRRAAAPVGGVRALLS